MPIMGGCPYCNGSMAWVEPPPQAPSWMKEVCDDCGKTVWRWLTRVNPQAWTEEDFLEIYTVDEANKRITVQEGKTDVVQVEYDIEAPLMAAALGIEWPPQ